MAKTLLNGVNEVLTRTSIVNSNNLLTSLDNSPKQIFIDLAVQCWNESVDHIFSKADQLIPRQAEEDQITLKTDIRTYSLPSDLIQLRWPFHNEEEGLYIYEYQGGYDELRNVLVQPDNYTGQPNTGAIDPIDGDLYIDRIPTSSEDGYVYKFRYWRDTVLERSTDRFPFDDGVFRAMVPTVAELWRYYRHNKYGDGMATVNFSRAIRMIKKQPRKTAYIKRSTWRSSGPLGHDPYKY